MGVSLHNGGDKDPREIHLRIFVSWINDVVAPSRIYVPCNCVG